MRMVEFTSRERPGMADEGEALTVWINPLHVTRVAQQDTGARVRTVIYFNFHVDGSGAAYQVVDGYAVAVATRLSEGLNGQ